MARDHRLLFPCGAAYRGVEPASWQEHVRRDGRVKLIVFDTQRNAQSAKPVNPPKFLNGIFAGCLLMCPVRKHRRQMDAMRDDGASPFAFRKVVTCRGVLEPDPEAVANDNGGGGG